jgi:hypothetical protein
MITSYSNDQTCCLLIYLFKKPYPARPEIPLWQWIFVRHRFPLACVQYALRDQRLLRFKTYYRISHSGRYLDYIPDPQVLQLRNDSFCGTAFIIHTTGYSRQAMQKVIRVPTCTLVSYLHQPSPDFRFRGTDGDCLCVPSLGTRYQVITRQRALNIGIGCSSS